MVGTLARSDHRIMSGYEYAEIVSQCALHGPAGVREWVDSFGKTHHRHLYLTGFRRTTGG